MKKKIGFDEQDMFLEDILCLPMCSDIKVDQTYLAKKLLDDHKIYYEELLFEDEGHGIYKSKNKRTLYKTLANFFEKAFMLGDPLFMPNSVTRTHPASDV